MTPAAAFSVAKHFHRAFELCQGDGFRSADGGVNAGIPAVVNLAFAIELGLKASTLSYGSPPRTHNLQTLYLGLPATDRAKILSASALSEDLVSDQLPQVAKAFDEWRYLHEESGTLSISLQFLMMLWLGVSRLAQSKVKEQLAPLRSKRGE